MSGLEADRLDRSPEEERERVGGEVTGEEGVDEEPPTSAGAE